MKTLGNRLKITRIATLVSMVCVFTFQLFAPAVYADTTCASGISSIDCAAINNHWSDWVPDPCAAGGTATTSGTPLTGSDNAQMIFNYFVSKGYTKTQAAGIVGNTQAESGSIPTRIQDGAIPGVRTISYSKIPANVLSEQMGWGIVQWTPPTKIGTYASTMNENPDALGTQIEFLWKQLEGTAPNSSEKPAGDHLKATTSTTDPTDATLAFMNYYERPANQSSAPTRIKFAKDALAAYGGTTTGSPSPGTSCGGGSATGCGGNTDKYAALVGPGATFAGVDQGIDFTPAKSTGYDICSPAAGTIVYVSTKDCIFARTSGCTQIREKLDQNPGVANSSQYIYYAEIIQVNSNITVGAHVNAGDVIGVNAASPGIEVGWATGATGPWLCGPGIPTSCGTSFNNWILQLSANLGAGSVAGACTTTAPSGYGAIKQDLMTKFKVDLQGDQNATWAAETYYTMCALAKSPTFYSKLTAQGTVPITLNGGACGSGFTSTSGVILYGYCDRNYNRFILTHELGHLFSFRNQDLYTQFKNGPWALHHAWLPTWDCQIHSFSSTGAPLSSGPFMGDQTAECWADMIGEYLIYFNLRETVGGAPPGSTDFKQYPTQYGDYYNFAKQLFGGVTYTTF
ncbi:MAG TPA: phage tail tip lysozyme [Candidatus Saccharimonadales bacterium]|nr:phage tail tip lysozyme [Candidatus Saccharimonadales bacterium]